MREEGREKGKAFFLFCRLFWLQSNSMLNLNISGGEAMSNHFAYKKISVVNKWLATISGEQEICKNATSYFVNCLQNRWCQKYTIMQNLFVPSKHVFSIHYVQ